MARQIDVKALISHIVKGDGAEKCRICMGDTSEGQVYLGDTVLMDGDKPVSLSELLEVITGVEVPLEDALPAGLCISCYEAASAAMAFRTSCRQAAEHWLSTVELLKTIPYQLHNQKALYAYIKDNSITFTNPTKVEEDKMESETERVENNSPSPIYQCKDCKQKFKYASSLHTHLLESDKQACFICGSIMLNGLAAHLKRVHKRKLHPCNLCPVLLASRRQLDRHMSTKHGPGAYSCACCGRGFRTIMGCHVHVALHEPKNCPNCDKLFRSLKCYEYHVRKCCGLDKSRKQEQVEIVTDNEVRIKKKIVSIDREDKKLKVGARGGVNKICVCDYCGKTYSAKKYVCAHIQIVHTKTTHRPCPYCGKSYAAAHMTEHIKKHEREAPSFTCEHCGVLLRSRLGHEQHLRLHTGEKPYACIYCSEKFSASSRRSDHVRKVHRKPEISLKYVCEQCPAKFKMPYLLKKHMDTVHSNKTVFKCSDCQFEFSSCRGLQHHRRQHQTFQLKSNC